jgi:hypothetical protein
MTLNKVNPADVSNDKELSKSHPLLSAPYLKLASGEVISTPTGIVSHIARCNTASGLFGKTVFQEAKVNEWCQWAECIKSLCV